MQHKNILASAALAMAALSISNTVNAQEILTGDTRLACETILCLSTGIRPNECMPSLQRYFSISYRKLGDTIRGRINFLNLCPVSNQTPEMSALVNAMGNGAGRCDAQSLNTTLRSWNGGGDGGYVYISNQMPGYCSAYTSHAYTDFAGTVARYVGTPEKGGIGLKHATMIAPLPNTTPASRHTAIAVGAGTEPCLLSTSHPKSKSVLCALSRPP